MSDDRRRDLTAALDARRDLGPEYDDALAASFLDRIDRDLDARVEARVAQVAQQRGFLRGDSALPLAFGSLALGVPLSAIAGALGDGLPGLLVAWAGIVAVNAAHALSRRPRGR